MDDVLYDKETRVIRFVMREDARGYYCSRAGATYVILCHCAARSYLRRQTRLTMSFISENI